jgi:hypothetical protein
MSKGLVSTLRWLPAHVLQAAPVVPAAAPPSMTIIPRPPLRPDGTEMPPVDQAIYLLKVASEIEHGLLVQYLFAAYSLDPDVAPPGWRTTLVNIAVQEMFHLLNVQNMLLALKPSDGSRPRPYFDRANFPIPPEKQGYYPFPFFLEPLTAASLTKYVTAESPSAVLGTVDLSGFSPDDRARLQDAIDKAGVLTQGKINHVGVLYATLYWMFQDDPTPTAPWKLPAAAFQGVPQVPATAFVSAAAAAREGNPDEFEGEAGATEDPHGLHRVVWPITSKQGAREAISQIAEQGEGTAVSDNSHFLEFFDLYVQYLGFTPPPGRSVTLNVPVNPNSQADAATADGRIDHPAAAAWARLFNLRYQILLAELFLILSEGEGENSGGGGQATRNQLVFRAIHREMKNPMGVSGLAVKLVQLPQHPGPAQPGQRRAAPPFELPADKFATAPVDQRAQMLGLIDQAGQAIDAILALQGDDAPTSSEQTKLKNLKAADVGLRADVAAMQFSDPPL